MVGLIWRAPNSFTHMSGTLAGMTGRLDFIDPLSACRLKASLHHLSSKLTRLHITILFLSPSSYCFPHNRQVNQEMNGWGKEQQLYSKSQQTEKMVDQYPRKPSYLSQSSGFFYSKRGRSVVGCCELLGSRILSPRSGHNVPINLQQDRCYSLFCKLYLCMSGTCMYDVIP